MVTNGCIEAIKLCLEAITKPGDIVAVEAPTYHGILQSLERRGPVLYLFTKNIFINY